MKRSLVRVPTKIVFLYAITCTNLRFDVYEIATLLLLYNSLYFITSMGVLAWKIIFLAMLGLNNLANIFLL